MGKIGTDVAREAAHMVLLDDNFSTIVTAVREGRRIFDNIRKFTKFVLTGNAAEIWTLFLAPFIGLPIPFLPIHILWVNLVTDGLPGLALSTQPEENNIMKRPPRSPKENIFAYGVWQHTLWAGLFMASLALFVGAWAYSNGNKNWQTMIFTIITTTQMFHVLAIKTERDSFFQGGIFSNLPLIGAVLLTMLLQMMITYIEVFNRIFKIYPLSLFELSICFVVSSLILFAIEFEKWLIRKKLIYQ
jgi:Ca2+-transporting ATPase